LTNLSVDNKERIITDDLDILSGLRQTVLMKDIKKFHLEKNACMVYLQYFFNLSHLHLLKNYVLSPN
jgi:hypothetical protein